MNTPGYWYITAALPSGVYILRSLQYQYHVSAGWFSPTKDGTITLSLKDMVIFSIAKGEVIYLGTLYLITDGKGNYKFSVDDQ